MTDNSNKALAPFWNNWRIAAWTMVGVILLLPLIAMQFTGEVNWDVADFIFAAVLLISPLLIFDLVLKKTTNRSYRIAIALALLAFVLLIWVNAAVGIFG